MLPFTHEQFLAVFAAYNAAVWPAQWVAYLLALALCVLAWRARAGSGRWLAVGLAAMWLWTGAAYHLVFFSRINGLAMAFGIAFIAQGVLFLVAAARGQVAFTQRDTATSALGWSLVAYSTVLYPAIGWASGMAYPAMPVFGITPCPVTLFTFGMLLLAGGFPWSLLVLPVAWAPVGGSAAALLHVPQDWVLLASPVFVLSSFVRRRGVAAG